MHPELSGAARLALRALPIDPRFIVEQSAVFRELLEKELAVRQPRVGVVLTTLGVRQLLAILVEEEMAAPCRCGLARSAHNGPSPHDAPENGCRAFTPATPVYTKKEAHRG
jgi:hypothetical protein